MNGTDSLLSIIKALNSFTKDEENDNLASSSLSSSAVEATSSPTINHMPLYIPDQTKVAPQCPNCKSTYTHVLVGIIRRDIAHHFLHNSKINSTYKHIIMSQSRFACISPLLTSPESRTASIESIFTEWREDADMLNQFPCLKGWRNERYSIWGLQGSHLMQVERAAAGLLGVRQYGGHVNGFIRSHDHQIQIWVARRSLTKQTDPGLLDNLVGGGLPHGVSPTQNMIKECFEEAGILHDFAAQVMKPVSLVTCYINDPVRGLLPNMDYCFDIEFPHNWEPQCQDGEVLNFNLMSTDMVLDKLKKGEFTSNATIVMLDFLIRHGIITPESEPDYVEICLSLKRSLPFPGPKY